MALPEIPAGFEPFTDPEPTTPPPIPVGFEPVPVEQPNVPTQQFTAPSDLQISAPKEQSLLGKVGQAYRDVRYSQKGVELFGSGGSPSPSFPIQQTGTVQQAAATTTRYGVPAAVALATAPVSIPLMMGTGLAAGLVGETGAQGIEQRGLDPRTIASSGVINAVPAVGPLKIAANSGLLKTIGVLGARSAAQTGVIGAGKAVAETIETGKVPNIASLDFWKAPVAIGVLGSTITTVADLGKAIGVEREAAKSVLGADPTLGQVLPNRAAQEGDLATRSESVRQRINDASVPTTQKIQDLYGVNANTPYANDVANRMAPYIGEVDALRVAAQKADEVAQAAKKAATDAGLTGNNPAFAKIKDEASVAAFEKLKNEALYQTANEPYFGLPAKWKIQDLAKNANTDKLQEQIRGTLDVFDTRVNQAYSEIKLPDGTQMIGNTPVVDKGSLVRGINRSFSTRDIAKADAIKQIEAAFGDSPTLTMEGLQNLKSGIANNLAANPNTKNSANRIAGIVYNQARQASDNFVKRVYGAETLAAKKSVEKLYANVLDARGDPIIKKFLDSEINEGTRDALVSELLQGKTQTSDSLLNLVTEVAKGATPQEVALANRMKQGISETIGKGLVARALDNPSAGKTAIARVNVDKLATDLNTLSNSGFPIESLGFGSRQIVNDMKRIVDTKLGGSLSPVEMDAMRSAMEISSTTPGYNALSKQGVLKAANELLFARRVKEELILSMSQNKNASAMRAARDEARAAARAAGMKKEQIDAAYKQASANPMMDLFSEGRTYGISKDTSLAQKSFIPTLLESSPQNAGRMMDTLDAVNPAEAENIRAIIGAEVFANFKKTKAASGEVINTEYLDKILTSGSRESKQLRDTFARIMGPQRMANLDQTTKAVKFLADYERRSGMDILNNEIPVQAVMGASTGTTGRIRATIYNNIKQFVRDSNYHTMDLVFINPKTAPAFRAAGYSLDKFARTSAANRILLEMAMRKDQEAKAENQPEPK